MKAVVKTKREPGIEVLDVEVPKVEDCDILVKVLLGLRADGAFAEYVRLTAAASIFKLPKGLDHETAALCEPLSVVLRAVDLSGIKLGQTAAVLGPGPIGLLALQALKAVGADYVMVAGTGADKRRLEIAHQLASRSSLSGFIRRLPSSKPQTWCGARNLLSVPMAMMPRYGVEPSNCFPRVRSR